MQVFSVSHWIRKIGPRWPNLGPSELGLTWGKVAVSWAPSWRQLVMLGWNWAQSDPDGPPNWSHVMHMEIQVTSVGTLWRQLHTKLSPTGTQHGEHCVKGSVINSKKRGKCRWKRAFWGFCIGPALSPLWSNMGLNLGRSCSKRSKLGPSYAIGRNWSQVGPTWAQVGPDGRFGQCWADMQNVQIITVACTFLQMGPFVPRTFWTSQHPHMVRTWCAFDILTSACASCHSDVTFSTSQVPKVVRCWSVFNMLTSACASHHNGVHLCNIWTYKSAPTLTCFNILTLKCASRHTGVHFFNSSTFKRAPTLRCL